VLSVAAYLYIFTWFSKLSVQFFVFLQDFAEKTYVLFTSSLLNCSIFTLVFVCANLFDICCCVDCAIITQHVEKINLNRNYFRQPVTTFSPDCNKKHNFWQNISFKHQQSNAIPNLDELARCLLRDIRAMTMTLTMMITTTTTTLTMTIVPTVEIVPKVQHTIMPIRPTFSCNTDKRKTVLLIKRPHITML